MKTTITVKAEMPKTAKMRLVMAITGLKVMLKAMGLGKYVDIETQL